MSQSGKNRQKEQERPQLLRVEHLTVSYGEKAVVKDVGFTLAEGEILGIAGESGSGKSTILRSVLGLAKTQRMTVEGDIYYRGKKLLELPERQLRQLRGPELGIVFQDCRSAMCPVRTVGAQIYETLREHEKISKAEAKKRTEEVMRKIGLTDADRIWNSYPFELSGGMNQRVGICLAMLMKPRLLLADEPTSALDVTVQKQVAEELLLMRKEYGTAMLLVTHNIGLIRFMADQVLVLKDGEIQDYGPCQEVLEQPQSKYTRTLLDSVLRLQSADGRLQEKICQK